MCDSSPHPRKAGLLASKRLSCCSGRSCHEVDFRNRKTGNRETVSSQTCFPRGVGMFVQNWWKKNFPEVPPQVVKYMEGTG